MWKKYLQITKDWLRNESGSFFQKRLDPLEESLRDSWQYLRQLNKKKILAELKELALTINKLFFGQIPGVSALTGIAVGTWIASTFTTSKFWGTLAKWGWSKGPSIVVSESTYKVLSVMLPVLATAVVMYLVQKLLSRYRAYGLQKDQQAVLAMETSQREEVEFRMAILDQARDLKLLTKREHYSKQCELYQSMARSGLYKWLDLLLNRFS